MCTKTIKSGKYTFSVVVTLLQIVLVIKKAASAFALVFVCPSHVTDPSDGAQLSSRLPWTCTHTERQLIMTVYTERPEPLFVSLLHVGCTAEDEHNGAHCTLSRSHHFSSACHLPHFEQ